MKSLDVGIIAIGAIAAGAYIYHLARGGIKKDVEEIKQLNEVLRHPPKITRAQKLSELDDPYLSDTYVKKIIQSTNSKDQLLYIKDRISTRTHDNLLKLVNKKLEDIEHREYLNLMIKTMKEKAPLSFDTLVDHFQHFI